MGSTPNKTATPIPGQPPGTLNGTVAQPPPVVPSPGGNTVKPYVGAPISFAPPVDTPPPMTLTAPPPGVGIVPNSATNGVGGSAQPDPRLAILQNLFGAKRMGGGR